MFYNKKVSTNVWARHKTSTDIESFWVEIDQFAKEISFIECKISVEAWKTGVLSKLFIADKLMP